MPQRRVVLVDTSILCRLVGLDGDDEARDVVDEIESRQKRGDQFVIPVTSVIETGNHVAHAAASQRQACAERLVKVVQAARSSEPPWIIRATTWDEEFLDEVLGGDTTGSDLVTLLTDGRMGTGDVAILVERDRLRGGTAYTSFEVWTIDAELRAHGGSET